MTLAGSATSTPRVWGVGALVGTTHWLDDGVPAGDLATGQGLLIVGTRLRGVEVAASTPHRQDRGLYPDRRGSCGPVGLRPPVPPPPRRSGGGSDRLRRDSAEWGGWGGSVTVPPPEHLQGPGPTSGRGLRRQAQSQSQVAPR